MALGLRCVKNLHTLSRSCPSKSLLLHEGTRTSSRRRVSALSEKADAPGCFLCCSLTLLPGGFESAVWRRLPSRHTCPRGVGAAEQLTHCTCRPFSDGRHTGGLSRQDRGRAQRLRKKKLRWRDQTSHPEASPLSSVHSLLYGEVSGRNIYLCPWHPGTPLSLTPQVYSFRRSKFR